MVGGFHACKLYMKHITGEIVQPLSHVTFLNCLCGMSLSNPLANIQFKFAYSSVTRQRMSLLLPLPPCTSIRRLQTPSTLTTTTARRVRC